MEEKVRWTIFFNLIFAIFAIFLLTVYWFMPFRTTEFEVTTNNANFSLSNSEEQNIQFYPKMRFPNTKISYKIYDCPLIKKEQMEMAFDIIENQTILQFFPVSKDEDISVNCDSRSRIEEGLFIAGEGGPTNITKTDRFNVILHGNISLLKESICDRPVIAIHELLHVLGFEHSSNEYNIMYNISKCFQIIGTDIPNLIDELYIVPSDPDLVFENVSAFMHGKYLDANISVRNHGLSISKPAVIEIYADNDLVKEIDLEEIDIGHGRIISLINVWIKEINVDKLEFFINSDANELDQANNKLVMNIKE